MADCKQHQCLRLAVVTLTLVTVVYSQNQPLLGQPAAAGGQAYPQQQQQQQPQGVQPLLGNVGGGGQAQQLGGKHFAGGQGQQLPQQQQVGVQPQGQALPGQQGSNVGQRADAGDRGVNLAQPANDNNLRVQPANMDQGRANSVDLGANQRAAKPIVQDNAQNVVPKFQQQQQQADSVKNLVDTVQREEQAKAQKPANSIPNHQADSKLAAKRANKAKTGQEHYKVLENVQDAASQDKAVDDSVKMVNNNNNNNVGGGGGDKRAKIPDIHGDIKDSVGDANKGGDIQAAAAGKRETAGGADAILGGVGGEFDLAHVNDRNKNQMDNKNNRDGLGDTNVDTNRAGGNNAADLPVHIKFVDGEVEKNVKDTADDFGDEDDVDDDADADDDEEDDEYYNDDGRSDTKADSGVIKAPPNNEIPKDMGVGVAVDTGNVVQGNNRADQANNNVEKETKEGSLKVVWDWTDFAVNFEQYVMPEQKIRRAPHASTGEPWPMPQYYVSKKDKVYTLNKANFRFKFSKVRCDIIEKAVERYKPYIFEDAVEDMYDNFQHAQSTMFEDPTDKYELPLYLEAPFVTSISIKIRKPCSKYPNTKSDESYDLFVKRTGVHLWANEVWGALRGLETFSQLVFKGTNQQLYIRDTVINDYPRFTHRGVMIDSARHFIFKETIYDALAAKSSQTLCRWLTDEVFWEPQPHRHTRKWEPKEGMAQNKMNVMHWHLVDDQSFPFYSQAYPDLSAKGAFHPTFVYMPEDIADIIEFARLRGIRVEPEFDTPGHTYSWGLSRPDLMTQCYQGDRPVDGYVGPMDPSKNETFRFLSTFFKDVLHVFKDQYLHLGGDEVPMTCWQSNPEVVKFLGKLTGNSNNQNGQTNDPYYYSYDVRKLLEYYVTRLIKDLKNLASKRSNGLRMVFWQEIMNNDVQLPNDTIIHVWQGGMEDVQRAISLGLNVIYSTCWYLDLIEYGTKWSKYYQCDPADSSYGFSLDESKVLGGEACLWAEYIDNENLMTTLWPRASAAAERLWSSKDLRDLDAAAVRLQEHRCRMLSRGLGVGQISGPDYCLRRGKRRHLVNETVTNCTQSQCAPYNEKGRVEVEKIKVEFEQKGGRMSDCSQAVLQAGSQLTLLLLVFITVAVVITLKFSKQKFIQVRACRNKTILMIFVTLILIYFMCYTSVWMQAMQFKGSFEKSVSSNIS